MATAFEENSMASADVEGVLMAVHVHLPWGALRERGFFPENIAINPNVKPGEFVLQTLFAEFTALAEKKIEHVLDVVNKDKPLSKFLQRGEDAVFDQLLWSMGSVCENSLPSVLRCLFEWYRRQNSAEDLVSKYPATPKAKGEKEFLIERRDLAVDFLYCLMLIEILKQLPYHPGHDDLVNEIINQCFKHFKYKECTQSSPNASNINLVSDLYAEVVGILAQSRFAAVRKRFLTELKELRGRDLNPFTTHSIVSLLMGLKFFRVKMHPIEEFQACFLFLHELGNYFLDVKDRDVKHALAGLFVEILLPVAAVVKNEVNVPVLKNFVEMMYTSTLDLVPKKKHTLTLFPLVTCLLCVSQKQYFLNNWPNFLTQCLQRLRDRDQKMARLALESLYRLLWVYMIRIKCESNINTNSRLQSIVISLFPKGSKIIMPKDAPLSIFVKIIHFIAQERLDFAMREILYDLLCVGKQLKTYFSPERMSIGLRAFLVIADSLQQRDGEPPMPQTMGVLPSGNTLRFKRTFISKYLSEETAKNIGMSVYYSNIRKAFDAILKHLDSQVGKPLLLTKLENVNREPDEIITGERKPKIDLFRICMCAIPRLLPDGMTSMELIELLSRLTVHMDDELGKMAFQSLQNMVVDLPDWRSEVLVGYVQFVQREVQDSFPHLLDQCNRRLISLLTQWKSAAGMQPPHPTKDKHEKGERGGVQDKCEKNELNAELSAATQRQACMNEATKRATLHVLEGFALVMLCSCKPIIRKLAVVVLKEIRNLFVVLNIDKSIGEPCVLDQMDASCPLIMDRVLPHLPGPEKTAAMSVSTVDFQWLADRTSVIWTSGGTYHSLSDFNENNNASGVTDPGQAFDPWMEAISTFMHTEYVMGHCPTAISHAWPILFTRLQALFPHVDPLTAPSDRSTLLRGSKKVPSEREMYLSLWRNYVVMGCCISPSSQTGLDPRSVSPELNLSSPDTPEKVDLQVASPGMTARELFKLLVPLIRCEIADMRETSVQGLGHINPQAFRDLVEEMVPLIREAIDRRTESLRRRKKRDVLRLALVRIFNDMAINGIFSQSSSDVIDPLTETLNQTFVDYIEGARAFMESEADKDGQIMQGIRLHFSNFIHHLVSSTPVCKREKFMSTTLRRGLCELFSSWAGALSLHSSSTIRVVSPDSTELEMSAVQALAVVLSCGPVYDLRELSEEGAVLPWLNMMMSNQDQQTKDLAEECLVLLLEFNHDCQSLLDWAIDCCYTASTRVACSCFSALATVFSDKEYPCDHVAMLNVTLLHTGCPQPALQRTSIQLLHVLYKRFFLDDMITTESDVPGDRVFLPHSTELIEKQALQEMLLASPYSRSQLVLSETLARLHPDLSMPMFSEITHRLQTATAPIRQSLLQYMLPWLHNMELYDPALGHLTFTLKDMTSLDCLKPPLKGDGWGSQQATEMVLNNLLYISAKFGDDHAKEIEDLWAALVACWPANLPIIVRYLVIIIGMAPTTLLSCAKRIVIFLGRAKPEKLVDELMSELRVIEPLTYNMERTQTPPFYRLSSMKKQQTASSIYDGQLLDNAPLSKGEIHTKRHSADDQNKLGPGESSPLHHLGSTSSLRSDASSSSSAATSTRTPFEVGVEDDDSVSIRTTTEQQTSIVYESIGELPTPYPLPMPAYGGYYAPLSEWLPSNTSGLPNPPYQRCNLSMMLLTDLVMDCIEIDWTVHLPLMLHITFLGLDHGRTLIPEHGKTLLLHLLLVLSAHNDHHSVAKILLANKDKLLNTRLTLNKEEATDYTFMESSCECASVGTAVTPSTPDTLTTETVANLVDVSTYKTTEQVTKALIEFVVSRKSQPLWNYEDITAKVHTIRSAEQLEHFLNYVVRVFSESQPHARIEQRWAQEALQLALSCSSRHYAGRSFQVLRALHVPLNSGLMSDVLSRLVETVAEQGEDMQGYVTEIMLTLQASVNDLDMAIKPLIKEIFLSTPNLHKEPRAELRKSATCSPLRQNLPYHPYTHIRSTSYSLSIYARRQIISSPSVMESRVGEPRSHRHLSGDGEPKTSTNLPRSRSVQSLKNLQDPLGQDDRLTILAQMFWISVSMLESDYEHEFVLAINLLDKILKHLQPGRPECKDKLDKILQQIFWRPFPGVQALLLKGCTSSVTAELTWQLLSKLSLCITAPVIDPTQSDGFAFNVMALLPYLVEFYEDHNTLCTEAADNIAQMCEDHSPKLDNLATIMTLYSRGNFSKDSLQWTKCVIKYLYDIYSHLNDALVTLLVEILERGPASSQPAVLKILHCVVHYIDINNSPSQAINADLFRAVSKFIESVHWRQALAIVKLCVTRSSSLTTPPPSTTTSSLLDSSVVGLCSPHTSFAETDLVVKKELPGRTMDFSFDQSQISVIGARLLFQSPGGVEGADGVSLEGEHRSAAEGSSLSPGASIADNISSGWKRPHSSQARVRERLANLLNCYGFRVTMPKSPSVIFSHDSPSDTLERQQSSTGSSSEEASVADGLPDDMKLGDDSSAEQQLQILSAFDFLDEQDNVCDFFGVKRHSINMDVEEEDIGTKEEQREESSDDETQSVSPVEDFHQDLPVCPTISLPHNTALNKRRSISGSMHSIHSVSSELDLGEGLDLSPSNASPCFSTLTELTLPPSSSHDDVEDIWKAHVTRVIMDTSGAMAIQSFPIFIRLFQELKQQLLRLTRDVCNLLARSELTAQFAIQLSTMLEVVISEVECAILYMDMESVQKCHLQSHNKLKFLLLELHEAFETYVMRRDQAAEYIEHLKSAQHEVNSDTLHEQKVSACGCVYRLHFQLLQLYEVYTRITSSIQMAARATQGQVSDISVEMMEVREELSKVKMDACNAHEAAFEMDTNNMTQADAEHILVDCLLTRAFSKALHHITHLRKVFSLEHYGIQLGTNVESLVYVACRFHTQNRPGVIAVCQMEFEPSEGLHVADLKRQLLGAIAQLETAHKPADTAIIMRTSDSSTL